VNSNKIILNFVKLKDTAIVPKYATDGSGCFDLFCRKITKEVTKNFTVLTCPTGIAVEVPPDWVLEIYSRSGHGFKYQMCLVNGTGIIDSDYRGEIIVKLMHPNMYDLDIKRLEGQGIAQAKLCYAPKVIFNEVAKLSDTARGTGGFGSTDKIDSVDRIQHG